MRLIDADGLLKALSKFDDYEYGNWYFLDGIETATKIVNDAPTVEPKHGHWEQGKNNYVYNIFDCFVCSKCGTAFPYRTPYCGECGAKMDVELEDEVT